MLPIPMYQLGSWEPLGMFPFPEHKERVLMYIDYHIKSGKYSSFCGECKYQRKCLSKVNNLIQSWEVSFELW